MTSWSIVTLNQLSRQASALGVAGGIVFDIRPEHVEIDPAGIPARVLLVGPTGRETVLSPEIAEERILASMRERTDAYIGSTVRVSFRKAAWHVFDANGMRLG